MRRLSKCLMMAVLLFGGSSNLVRGGEIWDLIRCHGWPRCVGPTTCDNYCSKPAPCVPPVGGFTCDDYCLKCLPCTVVENRFTCDDYCPKPVPTICCPWGNLFRPGK